MRNKFDKQLSKLNEELIHMGSMMEQSIEMAISALVKQDREKAEKTMLYADEIERKEKEIENMCFQILLSQQPVAGDLRRVSSAMKMVTDMKRIGDQAGDRKGSECGIQSEALCVGKHGKSGRISGKFL